MLYMNYAFSASITLFDYFDYAFSPSGVGMFAATLPVISLDHPDLKKSESPDFLFFKQKSKIQMIL